MYKNRYVYDALYGPVTYPGYVWEVLLTPELQRLREVRLCNINSLCLTGGANISRYEHSLGTAYLAMQSTQVWPWGLDAKTHRRIILAALLHDVGSSAFGHSIQYVISPEGFEHESFYDIINPESHRESEKYGYQDTLMQPIYFGMPKRLVHILPDDDLRAINEIISGKGPYGPLINGNIDLDNIDNVFRLAYHIGIVRSGKTPLNLAQSIRIINGQLVLDDGACHFVEDWYNVRRELYRYLLLNPDEFSAKCMLQEALELARRVTSVPFVWNDVDFDLLEKLAKSTGEVPSIISRLMLGDLYGCVGIYSTSSVEVHDELSNKAADHALKVEQLANLYQEQPELIQLPMRRSLEKLLEDLLRGLGIGDLKTALIAIHTIKDVNKTQRQIRILTSKGKYIEIGDPTRRVLIGVFFKNAHLSMSKISPDLLEKWRVRNIVREFLKTQLMDPNIEELIPYGEALK